MLQCVAVCCSVLQCVAVCCSVLQCFTVLPIVLCAFGAHLNVGLSERPTSQSLESCAFVHPWMGKKTHKIPTNGAHVNILHTHTHTHTDTDTHRHTHKMIATNQDCNECWPLGAAILAWIRWNLVRVCVCVCVHV